MAADHIGPRPLSPILGGYSVRFPAVLGWLASASILSPASAREPWPQGQLATHKTAHYTILVEGEPEASARDAVEMGFVLEAAWVQFAELLQAEPALKTPSSFVIRVQADKAAWLQALDANGVVPPTDLDDLCFVPDRDLVFLYRQPSAWFTRRLALHGAWQQFHCRAKAKHADLVNSWYVLGLAEHLSQHRWDGRRLELAAHPRITSVDLPSQAWEAFGRGELGLNSFAEEGLRKPAISWGLVGFLREGKERKHRARFDKLALGQTGSKLSGAEFAQSLGKPAQFSRDMEVWLQSAQEPLQAVGGEWEDLDGRMLLGRSPKDDLAFALVKATVGEVEAGFEPPQGCAAGLVLTFQDLRHYTIATISEHGLSVQRCDGEKFGTIAEYQTPPPVAGVHTLRARRLEGQVTLFAEKIELDSFEAAGPRMGFAVDAGDARFSRVVWK